MNFVNAQKILKLRKNIGKFSKMHEKLNIFSKFSVLSKIPNIEMSKNFAQRLSLNVRYLLQFSKEQMAGNLDDSNKVHPELLMSYGCYCQIGTDHYYNRHGLPRDDLDKGKKLPRVVRQLNFGQESKYSSKIEFLIENRNFSQKSKLQSNIRNRSKIKMLIKNRNFTQNPKWANNRNFGRKYFLVRNRISSGKF